MTVHFSVLIPKSQSKVRVVKFTENRLIFKYDDSKLFTKQCFSSLLFENGECAENLQSYSEPINEEHRADRRN